MELLDAILQDRKDQAREALQGWSIRRWETAYENLRRILARVTPQEFGEFYERLLENLAENADPDRAINNLERFDEVSIGAISPVTLARERPYLFALVFQLFGFSQFLSDVLIRYPHYAAWLALPGTLDGEMSARDYEASLNEATGGLDSDGTRHDAAIRWMRQMLVRLGIRVMAKLMSESEFMRDLSLVAAALTQMAVNEARRQLDGRFGRPMAEGEDGRPGKTPAHFAVVAMGKFGAMELNFSSDIDLIFVYSAEGGTTGIPRESGGPAQGQITNHDYFNRLCERIIHFLSASTPEGYLYRVDTRLRPDGEEGSLARSLGAFEIYHNTQARPWERMALIKASAVAGDRGLCGEFDRMSRGLVFDRTLGQDIIKQVRDLKRTIDAEVDAGAGAGREIKRGEGGIREIEFFAQAQQLLHGAQRAELRVRGTPEAIRALARVGKLSQDEAEQMEEDYLFLRKLEHRLQMMDFRQTHTIPSRPEDIEALERRMGIKGRRQDPPGTFLMERWHGVRTRVHERFVTFFGRFDEDDAKPGGPPVSGAERAARELLNEAPEKDLIPLFAPFGLESPGALQALRRLGGLGATVYLNPRGREVYAEILPNLVESAGKAARPVTALTHLENYLQASGSFVSLYEIFRSNGQVMSLLLSAFGLADSWAQTLIAHPEYTDDLLNLGALMGQPAREEISGRVRHWTPGGTRSAIDPDRFSAALSRARRFEYLMTGLGETAGLISFEQATQRLSMTADVLIAAALGQASGEETVPGFAVLGMGKLGTRELNYFSDLDLVFCWDDGAAEIDDPRATALAEEVVEILTRPTTEGVLYPIDTRLRPEGKNAPLAPPLSRYLEYYRERADLWELQSLTKTRFIAGDPELGARFIESLGRIAHQRLCAMKWDEVAGVMRAMRRRMEESVKLPQWILCDFKKGYGGVVDLEFLAQYFQLRWLAGKFESDSLIALRADEVFARVEAAGALESGQSRSMQEDYRFLRRLESRSRLLFETDRSQAPKGGEKWEALARAAAELPPAGQKDLRDFLLSTLARNRRRFEGLLVSGKNPLETGG